MWLNAYDKLFSNFTSAEQRIPRQQFIERLNEEKNKRLSEKRNDILKERNAQLKQQQNETRQK